MLKLGILIAACSLSVLAHAENVEKESVQTRWGKVSIVQKKVKMGKDENLELSNVSLNEKSIRKFDDFMWLASFEGVFNVGDKDIVLLCESPGGNGYGEGCSIIPLTFDSKGFIKSSSKDEGAFWCDLQPPIKVTKTGLEVKCLEIDGRKRRTSTVVVRPAP